MHCFPETTNLSIHEWSTCKQKTSVFLNEQESPKENTKENTEHGKTRMRIKTSRLGRAELYRQHNRAAAARVGALGLHML